jgi:hypothetical protein
MNLIDQTESNLGLRTPTNTHTHTLYNINNIYYKYGKINTSAGEPMSEVHNSSFTRCRCNGKGGGGGWFFLHIAIVKTYGRWKKSCTSLVDGLSH